MSAPELAAVLVERLGAADHPVVTARAPGRVNLIGEHTDYNDGFVLPVILDRHVEAAARRNDRDEVRLLALDLGEELHYGPGTEPDEDWPAWAPYLVGMVEEMRARDLLTGGLDLAVRGTLPHGAGLASSAALETATALALDACFGAGLDPLVMAHLCRDVEHHWAGVRCGMMDQLACRLGRPDHALLIDCRGGSLRHVPLRLGEHALVVIDSGVRRELADTPYEERRRECRAATALLARQDERIAALRDVERDQLEDLAGHLSPVLADRCRHVVHENARVLAAEVALAAGDPAALGRLMNQSHESLRDRFEASQPLVDRLVAAAQATPGVLGARLTGAGWGGCAVALCRRDAATTLEGTLHRVIAEAGTPGEVFPVGAPCMAGVVAQEG